MTGSLVEPRLRAVAHLVPPGSAVADVGSGDGRLARWLLTRGCIVTATEKTRAQACRLADAVSGTAIEVVEGFGLRPLQSRHLDLVVMTGLGGRRIARILEDPSVAPSWSLLLQPMQDLTALSQALRRLNRGIGRACLVRSRGRLYPIVEAPLGVAWNGGPPGLLDGLGPWLRSDPLWSVWRDHALHRHAEDRGRAGSGRAPVSPNGGRQQTARP